MKKIINPLNLMLLLLMAFAACQFSQTTESNYLVGVTLTPFLFSSITPMNTQTSMQTTSTPQLTPILPEEGYDANWESAILFQNGNDGRGIFYADSGVVHYLDEDLLLHAWSPSGKYLLFSRGDMLYIAEADGSAPQPAYNAGEIKNLNWPLGFTVEYAPLNPYLYLLDLRTGSLQAMDLDNWHVVEAVSPNGTFWIQSSATGIELAYPSGQRLPISPDLIPPFIGFPAGPPHFAILPNDKGFLFLSCNRTNQTCQIKLATITDLGVLSADAIFTLDKSGNISNLQVSANGEYLAFVQDVMESSYLYIIDLITGQLVLQYPWDEIYNPPEIMWSPDSQILIYVSVDTSGEKIMKLDIKTGDISAMTHKIAFPILLDWQYIQVNH